MEAAGDVRPFVAETWSGTLARNLNTLNQIGPSANR